MPRNTPLLAACGLLTLLLAPGLAAQDSYITSIANQVERAQVERVIRTLQDLGTRYVGTQGCVDAASWIETEMAGHGLSVRSDEFNCCGLPAGDTTRNVVASLPGVVSPEQVYVIGAHYDSISNQPLTSAPGADDNASGVAAVLEAARLLSGHQFEASIEFIAYSGEEFGRQGARVDATNAAASGKQIMGVINLDMIGYWPATADGELDIGKNSASTGLAAAVEQAALDYSAIPVHNWPDTGVCNDDHVEYWSHGYQAIVLMDCYEAHMGLGGESTPHYHRTTDTIDTIDLDRTTEAVRATVAALAVLARPVIPELTLYATKALPDDVRLSWVGGAPSYDLDVSESKDLAAPTRLTPPEGISQQEWLDTGALSAPTNLYYDLGRH